MRQRSNYLTCVLVFSFALLLGCGGKLDSSSSSSSSGGAKAHAFFIGSTAPTGKLRSDFADDWQQIATQFKGPWGEIENTRDTFKWATIDTFYQYAKDHNLLFHQTSLIWGAQSPAWANNLSATEASQEIEEWISQFCARYADSVLITVVNEPLPGHSPARFAQKAFGDDWITKSFTLARTHCPNSILLVNDFDLFTKPVDEFARLISPALSAGLIDGIGLEATNIRDVPAETITAALNDIWNRFGLPIYITDYVVEGTDELQLKRMQEQFPALYDHPKVRGISFASDIENETWFTASGLFFKDHSPRPAMQWLQNYVKTHPKD